MNGKRIVWIAIAAVVVIGSFLAGLTVGTQTPGAGFLGDYSRGYAAGMGDARRKIEGSGLIPPTPSEVTAISGTVKSVNDGQFVMAVSGRVVPNPLDPQGPAERTVVIGDKTQIIAQVPMTPDELASANKSYQAAVKAGKAGMPPAPFVEKQVAADGIKIGMIVTVTAANDIKNALTINATKITFAAIPSTVPVNAPKQ